MHLQHRQVQQLAQHQVLDQAVLVLVTTHLLLHRAHRELETIHSHLAAQDHVLVAV
jgi:hypothetical protein